MRPLYLLAATALAATAMTATPAMATVTGEKTSVDQGTLVHGNGGAADVGTTVSGTLGGGPSAPEIVYFDGSTNQTSNLTDSNDVRLQQGAGQAELTGAVISGTNTYDLQSGDIYVNDGGAQNLGMNWIELAFTGVQADQVTFVLTMLGEPDATFTFDINHDPNGENKFGFLTADGEQILNLHYYFLTGGNPGGTADSIRQVRINLAENGAVPEPATWAMMLLGFGAAGVALRRSRRRKGVLVSQLA
jgi:PEP-CTERM motif